MQLPAEVHETPAKGDARVSPGAGRQRRHGGHPDARGFAQHQPLRMSRGVLIGAHGAAVPNRHTRHRSEVRMRDSSGARRQSRLHPSRPRAPRLSRKQPLLVA